MAKAYRAVTRIEHGQAGKDGGNEIVSFEPGDIVRDLDENTMKHLWDNGALEEVDVVRERESDEGSVQEGTAVRGNEEEPTEGGDAKDKLSPAAAGDNTKPAPTTPVKKAAPKPSE